MKAIGPRSVAVAVAALISATGAYAVAIVASAPGPVAMRVWALAGVGSILFMIGVAVPAWSNSRKLQAAVDDTYKHQLSPLLKQIGKVLVGSDVNGQGQVVQRALTTVRDFLGGDGYRASYFRYDPVGEVLVPVTSHGRAHDASAVFRADQPEGIAVFDALRKRHSRVFEDLTRVQPPGWDSSRPRSYQCFIAAPVALGDTLLGMLTVDGEEPRSLRERDVPKVAMLAHVMALALADIRVPAPKVDLTDRSRQANSGS